MLVWGGNSPTNVFNDGGRYNSETGSWLPIITQGAPAPRSGYTAVGRGSEMIVWGGWYYWPPSVAVVVTIRAAMSGPHANFWCSARALFAQRAVDGEGKCWFGEGKMPTVL